MFKRTKSFSKQAKKLLRSKKGFFVDTGVMILISVVLGALVLGGLYAVFNDTVMPSVTSKVESMFDYSDGGSPANQEPELEEKYRLDLAYTVYDTGETSEPMGCAVDADKFRKLYIDGQEIKPTGYILPYGCPYAYVMLTKETILNLTHGMHTMKVILDDGYAEGEFLCIREIEFTILNTKQRAITDVTFYDWLMRIPVSNNTNGIVWYVKGDDRVYVDEDHTKYLTGVTWKTKIEEGKVYNEVSE